MKGFTLIEAMVAVSILTLAVAGPLFTANRAIVAAMIARDQLTASYLAQEGIEYVRSMRDAVYLYDVSLSPSQPQNAWVDFLSTTGTITGNVGVCRSAFVQSLPAPTCTLDPTLPMGTGSGLSIQLCPGSGCGSLYLASTNIYTQNRESGTATAFTRSIQVVDASPDPVSDVRIVSTVKWTYHGTSYEVKIADHLTPWQ